MKNKREKWFERLREMAVHVVEDQIATAGKAGAEDVTKLVNDIQVFQVELEMQNEELRNSISDLERSRNRFSQLFNMAPAGYILLDAAGLILDVNQTLLQMLGRTREDLIRKPFSKYVVEDDRKIFLARYKAFYKNPENKSIEVRVTGQKQSVLYARLEGRFIALETYPGKAEIEQFCLIVTDITESKKTEESLKNYSTMLNERNKELNCLYGISRLVTDPDHSLDDIIKGTTTLLPLSLQYPDRACCRITINDREYVTENFQENEIKLSRDIILNKASAGGVDVYYLNRPATDTTPFFIKEEADLIDAVAERIGHIIERRQAESALKENEQRLSEALDFNSSILETSSFGILTYNSQGRCTFANEAAAKIAGADVLSLLSQNFHQIESWKISGMHPMACRTLETECEQEAEVYVATSFEKNVWLSVKFSTFRSGGEKSLLVFLQDITEAKIARESLLQSERYLQTILRTTIDGFWVMDNRGVLIDANDAYGMMTGYKRDALLGMSIRDLDAEESPEDTARRIERIISNGSEFFETCHRHRDGHIFPVEVSATWLESEGGRFVCFGRDISERKKTEAKILYLQKAESLGRIAGAVAHHYNNLMQIVTGNLEIAREDLLPGNSGPAGNLAEAMKAARRASNLGGMMLAYLGHTIAPQESLDLVEICRGFLPGLRKDMPANVILEANLPGPGLIILANAGQIHQVLEILIINAWEAIGDRSGRVFLNLWRTAPVDIPLIHRHPVDFQASLTDYACLEVTDTGDGIRQKDLEKIFEPFYSTRFTGRGLGLPVALGTIKKHKGCITVTTALGRGSNFRVYLPVLPLPS